MALTKIASESWLSNQGRRDYRDGVAETGARGAGRARSGRQLGARQRSGRGRGQLAPLVEPTKVLETALRRTAYGVQPVAPETLAY
jgi:hypothetical protein